jgi:lipopolysaccharide export system ATP-binding protein
VNEALGTLIPGSGDPLLAAVDLRKAYRGRKVVDGVTLQVSGGEVVGLLGPNGAGKTTTFSMVVGLVPPDAGEVTLDGDRITQLPMYRRARRGVGYLPQEPSVFRKMTALENLVAILETLDLSRAERLQKAQTLLDRFKLSHLSGSVADTLSGGERRRLEIARALTLSPRFMLLDEPFAGIDPITVLDLQQVIRDLAGSGIGILITDHNVRDTLAIVDRGYIINAGRIFRHGSPRELSDDPEVRRVYLGERFRLDDGV